MIEELMQYLIEQSSTPYLQMLSLWIYQGVIKDPHCEFMIEEHKERIKEHLSDDFNDAYHQSVTITMEILNTT